MSDKNESGPPQITVYTGPNCPYCMRAKALLKQRGIAYTEILLSYDDEAGWEALTKKSGMQTVPQIFANETLIGGFNELSALDRKDQLNSLRGEVK